MTVELLAAVSGGFAAGAAAAGIHLWALQRSVAALPGARHRLRHTFGGMGIRLAVSAAGFYVIARLGGAPALLAGLAGFIAARTIVLRRVRAQVDGAGS